MAGTTAAKIMYDSFCGECAAVAIPGARGPGSKALVCKLTGRDTPGEPIGLGKAPSFGVEGVFIDLRDDALCFLSIIGAKLANYVGLPIRRPK